MRKSLIASVLGLLLSVSAVNAGGFRGVEWGSSPDQVKAQEGTPEDDSDKGAILHFMYLRDVAGEDAFVVFSFVNQKLASGKVVFTDDFAFENQYIDQYEQLKGLLKDKYGEPAVDRDIWENDLFKDDRGEWGMAVSIGHVSFLSQWELSDTEIGLMLYGENYDCTVGLQYTSEGLRKEMESVTKASQSSGL